MPDLPTKTYTRLRAAEQQLRRLNTRVLNRTQWRIGGGGRGASPIEFETYADGKDTAGPPANFLFSVMPGTILWQGQTFIVPPASGKTYAAQFTIPPTAGTFHIWIDSNDTFAMSTPTIQGNATIWSGSPTQPFPPSQRYWDLATIVVTVPGGVPTATLTMIWRGNISWPSIYGYWI